MEQAAAPVALVKPEPLPRPVVERAKVEVPRPSAKPAVTEVFNSSQIPGEIMDMMVVNSQTLKDNPALGKALTGAWFEVVALMNAKNAQSKEALEHMAKASGMEAVRVSNIAAFGDAVRAALKRKGPFLIEAVF